MSVNNYKVLILKTIVFFGALNLIGIIFLHPYHFKAPPERISISARHWQERIRAVGAIVAYKEFEKTLIGKKPPYQHSAAHDFGKALYFEVGMNGWNICGTEQTMGCLHEFFSEAMSDRGLVAANELIDACLKSYSDSHTKSECQHSLGHGLLSYLGYDITDFKDALVICNKLSYGDLSGGCRNGVVMEYNERFFLGPIRTLREPHSDYSYEPCDLLSGDDRKSCIYLQPNWWWKTSKEKSMTEIFKQIGKRCESFSLGVKDIQESCFRGAGYAAAWASKITATTSANFCDVVSRSEETNFFCRSQAAFTVALHDSSKSALLICNGLSSNFKKICNDYANRSPALVGSVPSDDILK